MISGIDHIALIVRDLDDTVLNYQALLGRSPSWRGALEGAKSRLMVVVDPAREAVEISRLKAGRHGSCWRLDAT